MKIKYLLLETVAKIYQKYFMKAEAVVVFEIESGGEADDLKIK